MIKVRNTLSNKKEEFYPQRENFVSMYVCGITPYDEVHLGHARVYVVFDIVKRHLLKRGYTIKHVQNFTDVDDKIIKRSHEKNMKPSELAQIYIENYFVQAGRLNILKAEKYPCVTQMIPEIVNFIKELVNKGLPMKLVAIFTFLLKSLKIMGNCQK